MAMIIVFFFILFTLSSSSSSSILSSENTTNPDPCSSSKPDIVVGPSHKYKTIQSALDVAATRNGTGRFTIHLEAHIYFENIEITNDMVNLTLQGEGLLTTIISGNRWSNKTYNTWTSSTVIVNGFGFIARDITFRNDAGPGKQAVALLSTSNHSAFYRCGFEGYQDTLCVHANNQFFRECNIYGTIDFIFGNGAVVFQKCVIYVRETTGGNQVVITAQGRSKPDDNTGFVIHSSKIVAAPGANLSSVQTYLGRPWKPYSRTVFLKTHMDVLVDPAGWLEWEKNPAPDTLYYGEYRNSGAGASTSRKVKWHGYRVITNCTEASQFTVANFIDGLSWLPNTCVPFNPNL